MKVFEKFPVVPHLVPPLGLAVPTGPPPLVTHSPGSLAGRPPFQISTFFSVFFVDFSASVEPVSPGASRNDFSESTDHVLSTPQPPLAARGASSFGGSGTIFFFKIFKL